MASITLDPDEWAPPKKAASTKPVVAPLAYGDQFLFSRTAQVIAGLTEKIEAAILTGTCATFEDYRYRTGQLNGLNAALAALEQARGEMNQGGEAVPKQEPSLYVT